MTASATDEVIRFVLPSSLKSQFQSKCAEQGQKMSERLRQLIVQDLSQERAPVERLAAILSVASRKNEASGLPEPSIEDIDAFIASVQTERISSGSVV